MLVILEAATVPGRSGSRIWLIRGHLKDLYMKWGLVRHWLGGANACKLLPAAYNIYTPSYVCASLFVREGTACCTAHEGQGSSTLLLSNTEGSPGFSKGQWCPGYLSEHVMALLVVAAHAFL